MCSLLIMPLALDLLTDSDGDDRWQCRCCDELHDTDVESCPCQEPRLEEDEDGNE